MHSRRVAAVLTAEQRAVARRAMSLFDFGLAARFPEVIDAAERLTEALDGARKELRTPRKKPERVLVELARRIQSEFERGRLVAEVEGFRALRERDGAAPEELPPLPPKPAEGETTFFDVRFVDEVGQGINGLEVEFSFDGGPRTMTTNAAGVALLEGVTAHSATVAVPDPDELESIVDPRWEKLRTGSLSPEANSVEVLFRGAALPLVSLRAALPHRVVIKPPLGRLFVELFDRTGRVRHRSVDYTIDGPMPFSGTTDERGRLMHDNVLPGDYELRFELETDLGEGPIVQALETQLVVLPAGAAEPEVRLLGAVPRVVLARLKGLFFETNKSFLLPPGKGVFERLRELYAENEPSFLLVVGHTDATGEPSINDPLSLERADNTIAFLKDDVDTWLAMYEDSVPEARRWADDEDQAMLSSMPDFGSRRPDEGPVRWFQRTRGLKLDGIAGPETRRQLVTEYMALDGVALGGEEPEFDIELSSHGCGENFPLDAGGEALEPAPADAHAEVLERRVELFFFDEEFGIVPKPPGKNSAKGSAAYPEWRRRAELSELEPQDPSAEPCHLDLELCASDGTPLPNRPCRLHIDGTAIDLVTDEAGRMLFGPLEPDDFLLQVGGTSLFVTSFSQTQATRSLDLPGIVPDDESADAFEEA